MRPSILHFRQLLTSNLIIVMQLHAQHFHTRLSSFPDLHTNLFYSILHNRYGNLPHIIVYYPFSQCTLSRFILGSLPKTCISQKVLGDHVRSNMESCLLPYSFIFCIFPSLYPKMTAVLLHRYHYYGRGDT